MDHYYWDLAARHFNHAVTPVERQALLQWRAADFAHEREYQLQKQLWERTLPPSSPSVDVDAAWQRVSAQLWVAPRTGTGAKVVPMYVLLLRIAACLPIIVGLGWLAQTYFWPTASQLVVRSGIKQVQVVLPDSSHVWLNRNSELRYANRFQSSTRVVDLKGEAFFQVRHNARQPFVVRTGRATTWVVGTSFNLRADSTAATVELSVVTGKVAFSIQSEKPLLVTPGHAARLDQRGIITTQRVAGSNAWAWQSGRLQFAGNPLHQVLAALERCYNVHFILPDARLANRRFTGTFNHASLEEVLHVLDATLNLHHVQLTETTVSMQEGPRQLTK